MNLRRDWLHSNKYISLLIVGPKGHNFRHRFFFRKCRRRSQIRKFPTGIGQQRRSDQVWLAPIHRNPRPTPKVYYYYYFFQFIKNYNMI